MKGFGFVWVSATAIGLTAISGCATLLQPGPDRVRITSNPSVAKVSVDGDVVCSTPCYARLPRKADGLIWVESEGFQREVVRLDRVPTGAVFLNLLFPPGLVLDLIECNVSKFPTDSVHVELRPDTRFSAPHPVPSAVPGAELPIESPVEPLPEAPLPEAPIPESALPSVPPTAPDDF